MIEYGRKKRRRRSQAKGWQKRVGRGAAIGVALLAAILTGMADELTREAEKLLGDLFRPQSEILSGQVRVIDADSLEVDGRSVRLFGIDAVEKNQTCQDRRGREWPCGRHATEKLAAALDGQTVRCLVQDTDRYGRAVSVCEAGGKDINHWVVRNGWAVAYTRYSQDYEGAEAEARAEKAGIFAGSFIPPEDWRRKPS
ncbi:thermonuclease family protein [Paracoccus sp. 22332]|uniref:thermonuclease family protein n=1 Tax=Paracoccus sp. 22332 TaxID=3453913 RepID=UPI003F84CDB1